MSMPKVSILNNSPQNSTPTTAPTSLWRTAAVLLLALTLSACVTNRTLGSGLDDTGADATLKRLLLTDTKHNYNDVDITVFESRVMLTGTVADQSTLQELESRASRISSATEILNEVMVGKRTGFRQGTRDALIDRKLINAMIADNGVYRNNYQVTVSQGVVYLLGIAQGPNELERVTSEAQTINGVKEIVSHVVYVRDPRRDR